MSLAAFFGEDVNLTAKRRYYLVYLLLLSFGSGAIDVFSVPALRVFVANNTGNVVFLALAASQVGHARLADVYPVSAIVALLGSWLGSFVCGRVGFALGRKRRLFVLVDMLFQAVLVLICCALYWSNAVTLHDGRSEYAVVLLLGYSMGSQSVSVKGMGAPPTISVQVATGAMAEFFSDPALFKRTNRARTERLLFVIVFFVGGITGGFAYAYYSPTICLLLVFIMKALSALWILSLPPATIKVVQQDDVQQAPH